MLHNVVHGCLFCRTQHYSWQVLTIDLFIKLGLRYGKRQLRFQIYVE